jgi:CheY-like chemotaxis protein
MGILQRILVLDDDPVVQMNLRVCLEDEGFTVLSAATGQDALQLLGGDSPPDLAVLDIRLAGMSGEEFLLRARAILPALRFLIHTASTDYAIPRALTEAGVRTEDVLIKPLADVRTFGNAINRLLETGDRSYEG